MNSIKQREAVKITGTVTVNTYRAGFAETIAPYLARLNFLRPLARDDVARRNIDELMQQVEKIKRDFFIRTAVVQKNILMQSPNYGLDLIIQQLVGMTTYPLALNYGEIGTGNTTPTIADSALTAPTNRAYVSFQQDYGTTDAIVQFIFSDSQLANGTYYEFGVFAGGTSTIGSGQLFNHALFSTPYVKVSGEDSTIEVDFSFS